MVDCLNQFQDNGFNWVKTGQIVLSTSGGGYTTSFGAAQLAQELTPEEVFALSEEFQTIRSSAVASLTAAGSPTDDDTVFDAMINDPALQGVRQAMGDYTSIRYPTYGPTR